MFSVMVKPAWMLLLFCMLPHQSNKLNGCHMCKAPLSKDYLVSQDKCDHLICMECLQENIVCRNCSQPTPALKRTTVSQPPGKVIACPNCRHTVFYEGDGFMKCPSCKKESCASCESMHSGMNCSDYYQSLSVDKKKQLQIKRCGRKVRFEKTDKAIACGICYGDFTYKEMTNLKCDHNICINCTKTYLDTTEQTVEASAMLFECPVPECDAEIPFQISNLLLKSKKSEAKNLKAYTVTGGARYCPLGCENIIADDEVADYIGNPRAYTCRKCSKSSCLACNVFPFHQGFTCELNKKGDVAKTLSLLKNADAQQCPKCSIIIERTEGCNSVKCIHCTYHFCWLCRQAWTKYSTKNGHQVNGACGCDIWKGTKKDKNR